MRDAVLDRAEQMGLQNTVTESIPMSEPLPRVKMQLTLLPWFDTYAGVEPGIDENLPERINWVRSIPFFAVHAACIAALWTGWSWAALLTCAALYFSRMFFITGFYHRYFSHRTFKTSRATQFIAAMIAASTIQRGPLWWASHHRLHHRRSDKTSDVHSPSRKGFWWSHMGWITSDSNFRTRQGVVRDLARFPELVFIDRFDLIPPLVLGVILFCFGAALRRFAPSLETSGPQMLVWGLFISSILIMHATFLVNSAGHFLGSRRYDTGDDSRNNFFIALLTLGEGWHNNHHHYPFTARQGFYWWELDLTYYALRALEFAGLVWDLKPLPEKVVRANRRGRSVVKESARPSAISLSGARRAHA